MNFISHQDYHFAPGNYLHDERVAFVVHYAEVKMDQLFPRALQTIQYHEHYTMNDALLYFR